MRSAIVLALLAGCYNPAYEDCQIACADNVCPSGLSCVAGMCRTTTGPCGGGGGSADATEPGTWKYRKRIVIPPFPDPVRGFPLLVNRVDADLMSRARVDGGDIKFTTIDGMKLAHEIETYDKGTGHLIAWVSVPLVATTGTELYMYYGNAQAPAQADPAGVWDTEYVGVWHLSDPTGDSVQDSTATNLDGIKSSTNAPASFPAGQIAGSVSYAGNDLFRLGANAADSSRYISFEAWIRRNSSPAAVFRRLLEYPAGATMPITIGYPEDGLAMPSVFPSSLFVEVIENGSPTRLQTEAQSLATNNWTHVGVRIDGSAISIFLNGVSRSLSTMATNLQRENTVTTIGGRDSATGGSTDSILGLLDEVRLSKTPRPPEYFTLSYQSQSKADFLTFGPAETLTP